MASTVLGIALLEYRSLSVKPQWAHELMIRPLVLHPDISA